RQVGPGAGAARALAPAREAFVDGLERGLLGGAGREMLDALALQLVADADRELREAVEHVELGERDAVDAADAHRLAHHRGVEPAAAALPPRDGAELVPARAELIADRVGLLGGEGAVA